MVPRPREFDIDEALQAATGAFWEKGYEATSVNDLMRAMSVQKGSLYKAFGDKQSLFVQALQRYLEESYLRTDQALTDPSPREGLRRWFDAIADGAADDCRGCFFVNSLVELGPHCEVAGPLLNAHWDRLRSRVADTLAQGQSRGEITLDGDPEEISRWILVFICGLSAVQRGPLTVVQVRAGLSFLWNQLTA